MIYLEKGQAMASTNSEEFASRLEVEGWTRIKGQRRFWIAVYQATVRGMRNFVLPGILALMLSMILTEGQGFTASIVALSLFYALTNLIGVSR